MQIIHDEKLDFNDVLIRPKRSKAASRSKVDLNRTYNFMNAGVNSSWTGVPVIAANMDTTGTIAMAIELANHGMMCCLHKHYAPNVLVQFFRDSNSYLKKVYDNTFYTLGIKDDDFDKIIAVSKEVTLKNICVDVANGYTEHFQNKVKELRAKFPDACIMAGNVATPEMVQELLISGACDIVKIGIGPGSVCTTRLMTGCGYPQLSAIIECAEAAHGLGGHICADGGCVYPADVVKAFGAGADFVMLGGMFAGTIECQGDWVDENGDSTKVEHAAALKFYGMSSEEAMNKYSGGVATYKASEGKCATVPYKGPVINVVKDIMGGLRSACAYVGAPKLKDLSKCTTFVRCSNTHNKVYEK